MADETTHKVDFQDLGAHALEAAGYAKAIQFIADGAHHTAKPTIRAEMLVAMQVVASELASMAERIEEDLQALNGRAAHV